MSDAIQLTDDEVNAVEDLHDHVYDMFFAQNAIIDMDSRHEITGLRFNGDDFTKTLIVDYAARVEAFLQYVKENPEKVARSLAILKGEV
ncbi:hypothetical protein O9X98_08905 [Agrobacterium salinitolerans]|nr:hypothetical protein [Agrobacterium salinitolerans]